MTEKCAMRFEELAIDVEKSIPFSKFLGTRLLFLQLSVVMKTFSSQNMRSGHTQVIKGFL